MESKFQNFSKYMKRNAIAGLAALTIAGASCCNQIKAKESPFMDVPSQAALQAESYGDHFSNGYTKNLVGKIVKVQPSEFSYFHGMGDRSIAANHEFEYVMLEDENGLVHTLIYPQSKAILEREANIYFRPLKDKKISAKDLVENYVVKNGGLNLYSAEDNFQVETEGIIVDGGIIYN